MTFQGFESISVDRNPECVATHVTDILTWEYRSMYPRGAFEIIFASPPGGLFNATKTQPEDMEMGHRVVKKMLEIIVYFKPGKWFVQGPRGGWLEEAPYMENLFFCGFGLLSIF